MADQKLQSDLAKMKDGDELSDVPDSPITGPPSDPNDKTELGTLRYEVSDPKVLTALTQGDLIDRIQRSSMIANVDLISRFAGEMKRRLKNNAVSDLRSVKEAINHVVFGYVSWIDRNHNHRDFNEAILAYAENSGKTRFGWKDRSETIKFTIELIGANGSGTEKKEDNLDDS